MIQKDASFNVVPDLRQIYCLKPLYGVWWFRNYIVRHNVTMALNRCNYADYPVSLYLVTAFTGGISSQDEGHPILRFIPLNDAMQHGMLPSGGVKDNVTRLECGDSQGNQGNYVTIVDGWLHA